MIACNSLSANFWEAVEALPYVGTPKIAISVQGATLPMWLA